MTDRTARRLAILAITCITLSGCSSEKPGPAAKPASDSKTPTVAADAGATPVTDSNNSVAGDSNPGERNQSSQPSSVPADSGQPPSDSLKPAADANSVEPIKPPATLDELNKLVEWEDRPVRTPLKLLEEDLAKSKPLASVAEALQLKNDSPQANAKIVSALGQLPEGGAKPKADADVTLYSISDMNSTNTILAETHYEMVIAQLYEVLLIGFDWNMIPFADGDLVESWQSSKDHMCDKFVLRSDLVWSDGRPIKAQDVVFSYRSIMNTKIPVLAMKTTADKLHDVVAYDDRTVVFFHNAPLVTNVWDNDLAVIPEHVYGPLFAKLANMTWEELVQTPEFQQVENHPPSGREYEMVSRVRNQEIVFKRRDDWYMQGGKQVRAKPYFDEVRFKIIEDPNTALLALKSGRLDVYEIQQHQWFGQAEGPDFYNKNTKAYGVEWTYFYFGWNNNEPSAPFFMDRRVRQAMSYAFDYHELLDKLLFGLCQQCTSVSHPEAWYAPKPPLKPYQQDQDKAIALLEQAGWADSDGDGIRDKMIDGKRVKFEFTMICKNDPERVAICQLMQNNLAEIGVQCNVQQMEGTRLFDRLNKKEYQACFAGWGTGTDPDEDENVWSTKYINGGRNDLRYSNPEVDRLFEEGRKEFDQEKRAKIYAKIDELIYRDQPCTFLYWRNSFFGFNKQLRGYKFSPRGPFLYNPGFSSFWRAE